MTISATVLSKPGCAPCTWVKRNLEKYDIPYVDRDVTVDPAALEQLLDLYADTRRGQHPSTPVTLLVSELGVETVFGPDIHSAIKRHTRAAAAA
ncbi:glutaredoxin family protein [Mycobacteroides abscessus]|uniref:glutaredoxin family protein n=1 Tax=Mycobacteroides abscessus TaxID=36809 RepID=UPI0005E932B6|nr:glutaredoxin domain-containing protein [Mycobacteroides abscessus]CPR69576.1 glutaredoxin [Mycobacteroides abscessus]CPU70602.1 glutaredoxin [Mycobacteroides abscessus]